MVAHRRACIAKRYHPNAATGNNSSIAQGWSCRCFQARRRGHSCHHTLPPWPQASHTTQLPTLPQGQARQPFDSRPSHSSACRVKLSPAMYPLCGFKQERLPASGGVRRCSRCCVATRKMVGMMNTDAMELLEAANPVGKHQLASSGAAAAPHPPCGGPPDHVDHADHVRDLRSPSSWSRTVPT